MKISLFISSVFSAATRRANPDKNVQIQDTGLYYNDYLQKIMDTLDATSGFKQELTNYDFEAIKRGEVKLTLDDIPGDIRTELDKEKRKEVERIRHLIRAQMDMEEGRRINHNAMLQDIAGHLDHEVPHSFTEKDVANLVKKAAVDLENYDKQRHDRFKKYEIEKKLQQERKLKEMDPMMRDAEEKRLKELKKKHDDHDTVNHPGSKKALEEVWDDVDDMKDEEFDPKTFFMMHDTNNDKHLDVYEVEVIMENELKKVYDPDNF